MKRYSFSLAVLCALIFSCAFAAAPVVLEQGEDYECSYETYEDGGITVVYPELKLAKKQANLERLLNKKVLEDCLIYVRSYDVPEGASLNVEPYEINIINGVLSMYFNGWYENSAAAGTSVPAFALNYNFKNGARLLAGDFLDIKMLTKTLVKTDGFTNGALATLESDGESDEQTDEDKLFEAQCDYVRDMGYNDVYKLLQNSGMTGKSSQISDAWVYIAPHYDGAEISGIRAGVVIYVPSAIGGAAYFDIPDVSVMVEKD